MYTLYEHFRVRAFQEEKVAIAKALAEEDWSVQKRARKPGTGEDRARVKEAGNEGLHRKRGGLTSRGTS